MYDYDQLEIQLKVAQQVMDHGKIKELIQHYKNHYKNLKFKSEKAKGIFQMVNELEKKL